MVATGCGLQAASGQRRY